MKTTLILSAAVLALVAQRCLARASEQIAANSPFGITTPYAGQTFFTSRGAAVTTGRVGNMQTTILPGGGVGLLMNNGNGTSTLTGPGGIVTTGPTPR